MSCRETSGNSATTSLIKFLTGAHEKVVSHEFHNLRREGRTNVYSESADEAAPKDQVVAFLEKHKQIAINDSRVKESRRLSLEDRFNQAIHDLDYGRGPNKATFYAWTELEKAVESAKERTNEDENDVDSQIGITPEGLEISYGDVEAARRMAQEAHQKLARKRQDERARGVPAETGYIRKQENIYVTELQDKAERIQAAYDATDIGYSFLLQESQNRESVDPVLQERTSKAEENRAKASMIIDARVYAEKSTIEELENLRQTAFTRVRHYESLMRNGKQQSSNTIKLQEATKELKVAQRAYFYRVAKDNGLEGRASSNSLNTPSEWDSLTNPTLSQNRDDIWKSLELISSDLDRARIRVGRISQSEAERRAIKRAQARQSLLDSENRNQFDPVNRKFAETERAKRLRSQKVVGV